MAQSINVTLPADVGRALDKITLQEGIAPEELIGQAVKEHLVLRKFRSLRARMAAKDRSQGIVKDQDVFDRIS